MRNIKLILTYDGTDFNGWQTQPRFRTIQETLEKAIEAVTSEKVSANASGRTDTGVHAVGQIVNFRTLSQLSPEVLARAINANLPEDVVILDATEMPDSFDAGRHALRKLYRYVIHNGPVPDIFNRRYAWNIPYQLNVEAMHEAAQCLIGEHDFHSFETEWPNRKTSIRTITQLSAVRQGGTPGVFDGRGACLQGSNASTPFEDSGCATLNMNSLRINNQIWIDVEADGFLYNMVRSIVGTLVNVGRGFWPISKVAEILHAEDRRQAGPTAPAHGLFLMQVSYPNPPLP